MTNDWMNSVSIYRFTITEKIYWTLIGMISTLTDHPLPVPDSGPAAKGETRFLSCCPSRATRTCRELGRRPPHGCRWTETIVARWEAGLPRSACHRVTRAPASQQFVAANLDGWGMTPGMGTRSTDRLERKCIYNVGELYNWDDWLQVCAPVWNSVLIWNLSRMRIIFTIQLMRAYLEVITVLSAWYLITIVRWCKWYLCLASMIMVTIKPDYKY